MPYSSNSELPSEVRDALPEAAQSVFRRVVTEEENKGKSESQAFATAWTAVKNGWHKNDKDEWVRKMDDVLSEFDERGQAVFKSTVEKLLSEGVSETTAYAKAAIAASSPPDESEGVYKNDELRILFGFGSVIETESGGMYVDSQNDAVDSHELVKATTDYMSGERVSLLMHGSETAGRTIHSFPLTREIAKALGIQSENYGWLVGVQMNEQTWPLVKSKKMGAFSIGARAVRTPITE